MSEQIKTGDLVQVVRPSKCPKSTSEDLGRVFTVGGIQTMGSVDRPWCANGCRPGHYSDHELGAWTPDGYLMPTWRLKRIPPLSELDDVKHDEEITA